MSSPDEVLKRISITDLTKKDLELAYALVSLGEEKSSADNHMSGAYIKEKYDQQTARRLYAKMFISHIESVLFTLRSEALEMAEMNSSEEFSQAELILLAGKTYVLSSKAEATERDYSGGIKNDLKFAFRCFAKVFDLKYKPDYSGSGWQAFQDAVEIRNRITHPKNPVISMTINDNEQEAMYKALNWFLETYHGLLGELRQTWENSMQRRLL